jgi:thiol:disulfide interchange protein DsbD
MKILKLLFLVTLFLNASGFQSALKKQSGLVSPNEAFKLSLTKPNEDTLRAKIILADKVHLNDNSLKAKVIKPKLLNLHINKISKPHKSNTGLIYEKEVIFDIPISQIAKDIKGAYTLEINFDGCSAVGLCYSTQRRKFQLKTAEPSFFDKIKNLAESSNSKDISKALIHENPLFIVFVFFILGLLLALTPCIFPMIPILSSIIVSQAGTGKPNVAKSFITSLIYVLSMAITYTTVGVISGLIGSDIQGMMQNPWMLGLFAIIFFALAISLFGYYEIQLPASWQSKLNSASDNAQGKGILGTAIMGFLSAFIIGPCVAPPLAGAILFISKTGNALLGGVALFTMSIGMGFPLLLMGLGAGKFMPKPGGWMTRISQIFGVIMLGLAIATIDKIALIPDWLIILLWSLLFMGSAIYMGVFDDSHESKGVTKLFKLLGLVLLLYGASLFIGLLSGSNSLLHPFNKFTSPQINSSNITQATNSHMTSSPSEVAIHSKGYTLTELMQEVKNSNKPVIIDFNKESCTACRELESITFKNPKVIEEMKRFKFISVNTKKSEYSKMMKKFDIWGTPNLVFYDSHHKLLKNKTSTGFIEAKKLLTILKEIK